MELSWREIVLFAYRTPEVDELDVWKEKDGRLSLYIQSSEDGVFFHLPPLSIFQPHLCVTWDSATGLTAFWVNGRRSVFQIYRSLNPSWWHRPAQPGSWRICEHLWPGSVFCRRNYRCERVISSSQIKAVTQTRNRREKCLTGTPYFMTLEVMC